MFHNLNLHFPDMASFAAWLTTQSPLDWAPIGSTYHNTFTPDESQWRGHASMTSMAGFYAAKGWTTGPHVYLASGTAHDGIWVMTPPTMPGTHAGACNAKRFGLEVVGNFDQRLMTRAQLLLLTQAATALHRWAGIGPDIVAHRDCMPGRTCPGDAAYAQKPIIQAMLAATLIPLSPYTEDSPILGATTATPGRLFDILAPRFPIRSNDPNLYTRADVRDILEAYWQACIPVGVNPLLAVSQMLHETGYLVSFWAQRPQRNAAGIGITGKHSQVKPPNTDGWKYNTQRNRWEMGVSFKSWKQHSIPAHVGRLLAYVLPAGDGSPEQLALRSQGLAARALPSVCFGSVTTLKDLGKVHNRSGYGWADDGKLYGQMIAKIATSLVGDL